MAAEEREKAGRHSVISALDDLRSREEQALVATGFEPINEDDLWRKDGVCFGRNAALQRARQELRASNNRDDLDTV